jgi:hypothetical protein
MESWQYFILSDVWQHLFSGRSSYEMKQNIHQERLIQLIGKYSSNLQGLASILLEKGPENRVRTKTILKYPFISKIHHQIIENNKK